MKIQLGNKSGSALLVTLVVTAVLGTALASYMKLVEYQNRSVVRSQSWNSAIPISEAGVEEALAHLNSVGNSNRAVNGWVLDDGKYHLSRSFGGGQYEVWIDSLNQPTVKSVGTITDPVTQNILKRTVLVQTTKTGSLWKGIVTRGPLTMNGNTKIDSFDSTDPALSTNGKYDPAKAHDLGYAGSVNGDVYLEGSGVWGSAGTGPNGQATGNAGDAAWMASHSGIQPGHYANDLNLSFPDVAKPFEGGGLSPSENQTVILTNIDYLQTQVTSTTIPVPFPVGGVTTNVSIITTPAKPLIWSGTLTTNTANMSSTTYPAAGTYIGNVVSRNVVSGHGKNATTVTYYDYVVISGYSYQGLSFTYNTVTTNTSTFSSSYKYVTDSGNYQMSDLNMSGHDELLVKGDTVLYVPGDWSMSGQSKVTILPGASLKVYTGGDISLSGLGVINMSQNATKFMVNGLSTTKSISISGNASFTGVIYAPSADVDLNGSGSSTVFDVAGAIVANTAHFNGNFQFHYDEMLGRIDSAVLYKVASWSEI
jgi:hypothetical protein